MFNIKYRVATLNDMDDMQTLFVDTITNTCQNDYTEKEIKTWTASIENKSRWTNKLNAQYFLIAELDHKMVGYGSLENGNYIDFLYVHKDFQGKGIAKGILNELITKSKKMGYSQVSSDVSITAKPFFQNKGFNIVRENKNVVGEVTLINYHVQLNFS